jgi:hypothetical protein
LNHTIRALRPEREITTAAVRREAMMAAMMAIINLVTKLWSLSLL